MAHSKCHSAVGLCLRFRTTDSSFDLECASPRLNMEKKFLCCGPVVALQLSLRKMFQCREVKKGERVKHQFLNSTRLSTAWWLFKGDKRTRLRALVLKTLSCRMSWLQLLILISSFSRHWPRNQGKEYSHLYFRGSLSKHRVCFEIQEQTVMQR